MVKSWLQLIFTIDSHRVGKLEDHGWNHWTALPNNYSLGTNQFHCQTLQARLEVAKFTIYEVIQSLGNWWDTEKQLASGRPAVNLTRGKRKQLVNAAKDDDSQLDKNANKLGVHQIYVQRVFKEKGWNITKENLPKRTSEKARHLTVKALLEAHDPDGWKSQKPLSRL